jgi:hypothetical protein
MSVPLALAAGFALAATIARDSGAKLAHIGIASDVRDAWCGLARDLERCSKAERRDRIRKLTQSLRPRRRLPAGQSPRALALLRASHVPHVPTTPQECLLSGTPQVRAGYVPEPALLALLGRIAQRTGTS